MELLTYKKDLNFFEKMGLKFHLLICKKCLKVDTQINIMDENLSRFVSDQMKRDQSTINKIKQKIKDQFSE